MDLDVEITKVVLVGDSTDTGDTARGKEMLEFVRAVCSQDGHGVDVRLSHQPFGLFNDSLGERHGAYIKFCWCLLSRKAGVAVWKMLFAEAG